MARRLSDEQNELTIRDNLSGTDIKLFYRMPTTKERIGYQNDSVRRENGRVQTRTVETRIKYGHKILTGIREGDFEVLKDGKYVPLSSDPASEFLDPAWKEHVKTHAADMLELLAARVFDAPVMAMPTSADEAPEDTDPDQD